MVARREGKKRESKVASKIVGTKADRALDACREYTELREATAQRNAAKKAANLAKEKSFTLDELRAREPNARTVESRRWYGRQIRERVAAARKERRLARRKLEAEGKPVPKELERGVTNTTENQRTPDPCKFSADDTEIMESIANDEFAAYFSQESRPQLMVTTCRKPCPQLMRFVQELQIVIPNFYYFPRRNFKVQSICEWGVKHGYTDVLVFTQSRNEPYGVWVSHLPEGPTSFFRLTSLKLARELSSDAVVTDHNPEVIFNHFESHVGVRAMRQLMVLFPLNPEFRGRRVVTFHNQRDFIFFRHHRYIFSNEGNSSRLEEIGPRFTLKLYCMHKGIFQHPADAKYEYYWRADMHVDRTAMYM